MKITAIKMICSHCMESTKDKIEIVNQSDAHLLLSILGPHDEAPSLLHIAFEEEAQDPRVVMQQIPVDNETMKSIFETIQNIQKGPKGPVH